MASENETGVTATPIITRPWEDFDTVLRHAESARLTRDTGRAHAFFARAIELNPNEARAWAGLAATAPSLDEAIISWAYTLALSADNLEVRGELDTRIEEKLSKSGIADAKVLVALGRTLAEVGQKPWAYRLLQRATELEPRNEEAWLWRAGVAEDTNETISCLKQVLAINPSNSQAKAGLKWAEERIPPSSTQVPSAETQEAATLFEQGQQAIGAGIIERANDLFRRATALDPQNEAAWFWRGSTAQSTDEAITCMERTLSLNPRNESAKDTLWWLRVRKMREVTHLYPAPTSSNSTSTPEPSTALVQQPRNSCGLILSVVILLALAALALAVVVIVQSVMQAP